MSKYRNFPVKLFVPCRDWYVGAWTHTCQEYYVLNVDSPAERYIVHGCIVNMNIALVLKDSPDLSIFSGNGE